MITLKKLGSAQIINSIYSNFRGLLYMCPRFKMTFQGIKYLSQKEAINLDQQLFNEYAFSVDQLMELAGLGVATAVAKTYNLDKYDKPIICCGPGNNGGDGLVCARHLKLFGYSPTVICPKPSKGQLYRNLIKQCEKFQIPVLSQLPEQPLAATGNLVIDSIFGFSFKPPNRNKDFANLLKTIHETRVQIPIVSVDIPSGWHVEKGPSTVEAEQADVEPEFKIPALEPDCLISLTAPKLCSKYFKGQYHYLSGRFCPQSLVEEYGLNLPPYSGTDAIVLLSG